MKARSKQVLEPIVFEPRGDFIKSLRSRVNTAFSGRQMCGSPRLRRKAMFISLWFATSYVAMLSVHSVYLQIALCFSYAVAASAVGFNIFHDANHGTLMLSRRANHIISVLTCCVLGSGRYFWAYKHHVLHHRFTNIYRWDDDLETRGFLRLSPHQPWQRQHRWQHRFFVFAYAFATLEWFFIKDFVQYFTLRINEHRRIPPMKLAEHVEFWLCKMIYIGLFVGLPFMLLPASHVIVGLSIFHFTFGVSLALVFNLAHGVEGVHFVSPRADTLAVADDWASHQMKTTANFATRHPFWNWFTGGLNHQIEHHLFPGISHDHYPEISRIVRSTASQFALPYVCFETYGEALTSHFHLLRTLSREAVPEAETTAAI